MGENNRFQIHRATIIIALLVGTCIVSLLAIFPEGIDHSLVASGERRAAGSGSGALDLWFGSDGQLVVVEAEGAILRIFKGATSAPLVSVDLAHELGLAQADLRNSRGFAQPRATNSALAADHPINEVPFAVSEDGLSIAWTWKGDIWVQQFTSSGDRSLLFKIAVQQPPISLTALTFLNKNMIAVLPEKGEIRAYRLGDLRPPKINGLPVSKPWTFWTRGSVLLAASKHSQPSEIEGSKKSRRSEPGTDVLRISFDNAGAITANLSFVSDNATSFASDSSGDVFVGGSSGKLQRRSPSRGPIVEYLSDNAAIRAIAVHGDNIALGGDFSGVVISKTSSLNLKHKVLDAPPGILSLSLSGSQLAYSTADSAEVVSLVSQSELNGRGNLALVILSLALSLIAATHGLMIDKKVPNDGVFAIGQAQSLDQQGDEQALPSGNDPSTPAADQQREIARQQTGIDP
jgi:hypothetical protein